MSENKKNCSCDTGNKIVMSCSGASDLGCISDKVARMLQVSNKRKMNCIAKAGLGMEKVIEQLKTKDILIIDGCKLSCGQKIMEKNGITNYKHIAITELGLIKGDSNPNDENLKFVYNKISDL
ncbi:MAG: putative zinc-binding protein [Marinifilaceae bacterium]|jgi:uncharacterized metal-binding protein|nr:putative zinc-binding protein [Marinifilaceae bacterium]